MNDDLEPPCRRSIRLPGYDYGQTGGYFVTICTQRRGALFGEVIGEQVRLSAAGEIVAREWERTGELRAEVLVDAFVVMPNHLHGILWILRDETSDARSDSRATQRVAPTSGGGVVDVALVNHGVVVATRCVGPEDGLAHGVVGATRCVAPEDGLAHGVVGATRCVGPEYELAHRVVGATRCVAPPSARGPRPGSLSAIVGQVKAVTTRQINELCRTPHAKVWQRNFYEHVIRDDASLARIRRYIELNPVRWAFDPENPAALSPEPADAWLPPA